MSARNTLLFGAALAVTTAAIAVDHATHPVPERPAVEGGAAPAGSSPCAAAPCAAGAPAKRAPPPPPPAARPALPPPPPLPLPDGQEAPDLAVGENR